MHGSMGGGRRPAAVGHARATPGASRLPDQPPSRATSPQPRFCARSIKLAKSSIDLLRRSSFATTSTSASPWSSCSSADWIPGRLRSFAECPASLMTGSNVQPRVVASVLMAKSCAVKPAPLFACSSVLTRRYGKTRIGASSSVPRPGRFQPRRGNFVGHQYPGFSTRQQVLRASSAYRSARPLSLDLRSLARCGVGPVAAVVLEPVEAVV